LVTLPVSPEDLAAQVELAATDVMLETQLAARDAPAAPEVVAFLTDAMVGKTREPASVGAQTPEQVAIVQEARNEAAALWKDVRGWLKTVFRGAKDKLKALAEKLVDLSQKLGVTVEHMVSRLYRRVMRGLVEASIMAPFTVTDGDQRVSFKPAELTFTFTLKAAPSLASLDVAGVVTLLSGLMELELSVDAKYAAA
jgi:hypothetical protein